MVLSDGVFFEDFAFKIINQVAPSETNKVSFLKKGSTEMGSLL